MALAKAIKMLQPKVGSTASNTLIKPKPQIASSTMNPGLGGRPPITFNPYSTDFRPPQGMQPMMPMQGQPRPPPALAPNPGKPGTQPMMPPQNMPMRDFGTGNVRPPMMPSQGMPMQGQPRPLPQFAPNPGRPANMDMPQGLNTLVKPQTMTDFGGGLSSAMLQDLAGRYGLDANALFGNFQVPQVQNQQMPNNNFGNQPMTRFPDSNSYQMFSPFQMGSSAPNQMNSMQPMQNYQQQSMFPQSGYQLQQPQQQPQQSMYPQYGNFGNQFANQNQGQNFGGLDSAIQNMNQNNSWF